MTDPALIIGFKIWGICAQANKKGDPELIDQAKRRREVVELVWKHIDECESLEKKRFGGDKVSGDRIALLSGGTVGRQGSYD